MEVYNFIYLFFLTCIVAIIGIGIYFIFIIDDVYGYDFCERQGYDGVDLFGGGSYSKYYGKLTCYAKFQGNTTSETFNVERKFGRFVIKE